ncbi:MAG: LPXTG cell wall anchor domain-containing protein [Candidatus Marinimicrobia bacterium]|jgi:LPXTG-motif cell wall-anchored protein|nr:LPXTG cell wall anchor domain-containing protein [Candidatus Neomarinimicrobiota bacterium]MBT3632036.1 LPXTG cell wall anchor domain-containing protein [Candidatus Neomarinimicrobiota bacterium]MBT3824622.1 LPXTG cell wall anchor domain-containing protein [Candidatus Neomarinimicrobiota bacterium]MBT4130204.1 LPXTG cell wall anchor domain-containing protein [Candidatus Neomarinimicrobiota bacterium]MBT4296954.1 LPXTG cell wall anchor domain-containing protein [Candidatus Neomarinimicrobiota
MTINIGHQNLILILIGLFFILIALITFLLRRKKKKKLQESIPGVEEMAKTTFFWANYHRGKLGEDDSQ